MTAYSNAPLKHALLATLLLTFAGCAHLCKALRPAPVAQTDRAQLSIGYTMLYEEADGIHKLKWIMMLKDKHEEMQELTTDLLNYYQHLAAALKSLAARNSDVPLDVTTMSDIEAQERKAVGNDLAKDMAPLIGKGGVAFERETLLMFYNALNEQRHLIAVMLPLETDGALKGFLENTRAQMDERYAKIRTLLNRRYYAH